MAVSTGFVLSWSGRVKLVDKSTRKWYTKGVGMDYSLPYEK